MATANQLLELIFCWIEEREHFADNLRKLAEELESLRKKCNVGECVGSSFKVLGAANMIGAGLVTFFTGGLAPVLMNLSSTYTGIGSTISIGTKIIEGFLSCSIMKKLQDIEKKSNEIAKKIQQILKPEKEVASLSEEADELEHHIMAEILRAIARQSGVNVQIINDSVINDMLNHMLQEFPLEKISDVHSRGDRGEVSSVWAGQRSVGRFARQSGLNFQLINDTLINHTPQKFPLEKISDVHSRGAGGGSSSAWVGRRSEGRFGDWMGTSDTESNPQMKDTFLAKHKIWVNSLVVSGAVILLGVFSIIRHDWKRITKLSDTIRLSSAGLLSSDGFLSTLTGGVMVVGGIGVMACELPEMIDNWTKMIKGNHVTEASQSLRDTADGIQNATQTMKEQIEKIKKILQEIEQEQQKTEVIEQEESSEQETEQEQQKTEETEQVKQKTEETEQEQQKTKETEQEQQKTKVTEQVKQKTEETEQVKQKTEETEQEQQKTEETEQEQQKTEETEQEQQKTEETEQEQQKTKVTEQVKQKTEETEQVKQKTEETEQEQQKTKVTEQVKQKTEETEQEQQKTEETEQEQQKTKVTEQVKQKTEETEQEESSEEETEDPPAVKVGLLNVRSILSITNMKEKRLNINNLITEHNLDVFLMTETWLENETAAVALRQVAPQNFKFHQESRIGRGGGVAIQFSPRLLSDPIRFDSITVTTFEYVAKPLRHKEWDEYVLFINIYRPPRKTYDELCKFVDEFEKLLKEASKHNCVIVAGDFNVDLGDNRSLKPILLQIFTDRCSFKQHVKKPTHIKGGILDLVFSRNVKVRNVEVNDDEISDHYTVYFRIRPKSKGAKTKANP